MERNGPFDAGGTKKLQFTDVVGNFGKWQLIVCLNLWLLTITNAFHNFIITFHAPKISYHCSMPEDIKGYNVSITEWVLHGIPRDDGGTLSSCTMYKNWDIGKANRSVVQCNQWDYNTSIYSNTIVSKFDLVCDREWMISFLKSCYMFGYMGAGVVVGISDRFGRRPVILASMCLFLISALLSAFSVSFTMLAVLRCLLALAISTCSTTGVILQTEISGAKERVDLIYVRTLMWSLAMLLLVGTAYFIRDWFWLQLTVTLPVVLLAVCIWWFLPESPRFLLTHGHKDQASATLKAAARYNGITIDDEESVLKDLMKGIQEDDRSTTHASWFDLFRTPELKKRILILHCLWFVMILAYYSMMYNTNRLHGDMYVNFTLYVAAEIPGSVAFYIISSRIGRRKSLFISITGCGATYVLTQFVPEGHQGIITALFLIGRGFIRGSLIDGYLYTMEVLPTVVRGVGLGSCSTFSRFGGIIAPFALNLGNVSVILLGVLCIAVGVSILLLPETHNKHMSDTVKEAKSFDS